MKKIIFIFSILCCKFSFGQRPAPAPMQSKPICILGGTIHVGNGKILENGFVLFENGKIIEVGLDSKSVDLTKKFEFINAQGKHIYPGLIATNNSLGLTEIEAVRATNDYSEIGNFNPNVNAAPAFYTDSKVIPTVRTNGILLVQSTPRGGVISGASSILQLDAWNYEDAIIKFSDGIHLNWPQKDSPSVIAEDKDISKADKANNYNKQINALIDFFAKAKSYSMESSSEKDLRYESMKGIFSGVQNLYLHAQSFYQISDAISLCQKFGITKPVIVGGAESQKASAILKNFNVPVMLQRVHSLPPNADSNIDFFYKLPAILKTEGILFCLQNEGDMEAMNARNLPFLAGTSVAHGLGMEDALRAITLDAATILGISNKYGSIEVGKSATLFISKGNALDMMTNNLEDAFIDGRKIDLNNQQKELYQRYSNKYGIK